MTPGSGSNAPFESLRRKADFERAYRKGRRLVSPLFVAFAIETELGRLRVGIVASRKVGGAVARNRAKRLLREVSRRTRPRGDVSADVVLVARSGLSDASYGEVEAQYRRGVSRWLEKHLRAPR